MLEHKKCTECGKKFTPKIGKQIYCSYTCRDRNKQRRYRRNRKMKGLCVQCGKPMPERTKGTYKKYISYCKDCKIYFKKRYLENKQQEHK